MSIVIEPGPLRAWGFPEDAAEGKAAFLAHWTAPMPETWLRAYAFTMRELADAIIAQHALGAVQHIYIDKSETRSPDQLVLVREVVAAGVEVTIGTSPAGAGFIAHTKSYFDADGDCWEGSTNFSESAWHQVNSAFQFNSPEWRDWMRMAFERDVAYAWAYERGAQLMTAPPHL